MKAPAINSDDDPRIGKEGVLLLEEFHVFVSSGTVRRINEK